MKKSVKTSKKQSLNISIIIYSIITFIFFVLIAVKQGYTMGSNSNNIVFDLMFYSFSMLISYFLVIIIHEAGHLVMGLLTGYSFLSFRIGSVAIVKRESSLKIAKFSLIGTAGQCLLSPPDVKNPEQIPYFLYLLGGGLFNILTVFIALPLIYLIDNFYLSWFAEILAIYSAYMALNNLIPIKITIPNDGYNLYKMHKNINNRISMYKQLKINALLYNGLTPSEIDTSLIEFEQNNNLYSQFENIIKASVLCDKKDFVSAENILCECYNEEVKIKLYFLECKALLLFCKIMNNKPSSEIDDLYDDELKKYITATKNSMLDKRRIMYAYYLIYKKDINAAQKEYNSALKLAKNYPILGELKSELSLIDYIKNKNT